MMKKYRFEVFLFLSYLLLAIVFTWSMAAKINSSVYGLWGDHFGQLWSDWWREKAIFSGKSFFCTPLLDAPFGFCYNAVGFQPLHTALRFVLSLLTNEVLSLNILLLLSFPLSGLATYFLVKRLTRNKWASAFSGLIYAFSMYQFSHAWEHSSLVFIFWMPFYVWALVKFSEKKNIENAVLASLAFAAVLLDNLYYGYFTFFFTAFFLLFQVHQWFNWRNLKLLALFFLLCSLFSIPFILPTVKTAVTSNVGGELEATAYKRSFEDLNWLSARPWYYVLPSPRHPLWGNFSQKILDWIATKPPYFLTQQYDGNEHNLCLTWTAIILSAVAVFKPPRKTLRVDPPEAGRRKTLRVGEPALPAGRSAAYVPLFLFLGIVMMIFSAPPMATLSGLKIYFPSHFLYKIFPMFRAYARFGVLVLLCVSVLAGFGLKALFEKIRSRKFSFYACPVATRSVCFGVFLFLCFFALLEVLLPSFNVDLTPPEAYQWLKDQPGDFIVAEFPPRTDHSGLLYQRFHGKRLFNPTVENPQNILHASEDQVSSQALLYRNLRERSQDFPPLGVKYVIFHEGDPFLDFNLGYFREPHFKIVQRSGETVIYEIMEVK